MKAIQSTLIALSILATSGFVTTTLAKEVKTNSETLNHSNIQKNTINIKTPQKETTPQQKCRRSPWCK